MNEIRILELVWDDFNEAHIWERHQLTRIQVESISYGGRFLIVGPGADSKLYAVTLGLEGENTFYPVSARRASKKERREYAAWKVGTSNE